MALAVRADESLVQWLAPAPLWSDLANQSEAAAASRRAFRQPTILRFATDSFMDDVIGTLNTQPRNLAGFRAVPETWTEPAVGTPVPVAQGATPRPLKLYNAAHQRFYLVATCLVCRLPGLPDRILNTTTQESATFVLRRLVPRSTDSLAPTLTDSDEHAFVSTPGGQVWQPAQADSVVSGEERIGLFPLSFRADDGRARRLLAGLVPVGKREVYVGAPLAPRTSTSAANGTALPKTARKLLLQRQVIEPWKAVFGQAATALRGAATAPNLDPPIAIPANQKALLLRAAREQLQVSSWYVLLELASFLRRYLSNVWDAVLDPAQAGALELETERALFDALEQTALSAGLVNALATDAYTASAIAPNLRSALAAVVKRAADLEAATAPYSRTAPPPVWPDFLFPVADANVANAPEFVAPGVTPSDDLEAAQARLDTFTAVIVRALPTESNVPTPPVPAAAQVPIDVGRDAWFVIRCVFERPNCGPIAPPIVSEATEPFQMASFFDSDAPARPIRIALPIDTSPAGLRKFDKNTAFMVSDMLCGQIKRARGMSLGDLVLSVLPWPFHQDLPAPDTGPCTTPPSLALGMICSLSIPIITICALILLMIIVNLLDLIFRWIPFFITCIPLPGFSGKRR